MNRPLLAFLTDYGASSEFVGICHGVARSLSPVVDMIDICHTITPFNVREGAFVLERSLRHVDASVYVAVVDPGVGGNRRAVALQIGDRHFVGPDNGLLIPAATASGQPFTAVALDRPQFWLAERSATFDGRDVFVPVGIHLAAGIALDAVGSTIDPASLRVLAPYRFERIDDTTFAAEVVRVDSFGNITTSIDAATWQRCALAQAARFHVTIGESFSEVTTAAAFSDLVEGALLAFIDSYEHLAIAANQGRAAALLDVRAGDEIVVQLRH